MDSTNRFATRGTYTLLRLEYLAGLITCIALTVMHIESIDWLRFVGLFVVIDLVGYIPGAVAWRRSRTRPLPPVYTMLYNLTHSFLFIGAVALLWTLLFGAEWALLAMPIHLCGDRALFGNMLKSRLMPFEPEAHPLVASLEDQLKKNQTLTEPAP